MAAAAFPHTVALCGLEEDWFAEREIALSSSARSAYAAASRKGGAGAGADTTCRAAAALGTRGGAAACAMPRKDLLRAAALPPTAARSDALRPVSISLLIALVFSGTWIASKVARASLIARTEAERAAKLAADSVLEVTLVDGDSTSATVVDGPSLPRITVCRGESAVVKRRDFNAFEGGFKTP
jgi:hypothetical protein